MSKLIFVQKLLHFEVSDFNRISYKRTDKIDVLRYFAPNISAPSICVQISRDLHQITTPCRVLKLRRLFKEFWKLAIAFQFWMKNFLNLSIFRPFFINHGFFDLDSPYHLKGSLAVDHVNALAPRPVYKETFKSVQ